MAAAQWWGSSGVVVDRFCHETDTTRSSGCSWRLCAACTWGQQHKQKPNQLAKSCMQRLYTSLQAICTDAEQQPQVSRVRVIMLHVVMLGTQGATKVQVCMCCVPSMLLSCLPLPCSVPSQLLCHVLLHLDHHCRHQQRIEFQEQADQPSPAYSQLQTNMLMSHTTKSLACLAATTKCNECHAVFMVQCIRFTEQQVLQWQQLTNA